MKIGIMGSHYVGKTTLGRKLKAYLESKGREACLIGEVVRKCPFPVNEKTTFEAQFWIQLEQMRQELENEKEGRILITDRTVLDNFAYMARKWKEGRVGDANIRNARNLVSFWVKTYDYIFLIQPFEAPEIEDDNFRSTDKSFRQEIHKIIEELAIEMNVPFIRLAGNKDEVFRKAVESISSKL